MFISWERDDFELTRKGLLEILDGNGIIITDQKLLDESLKSLEEPPKYTFELSIEDLLETLDGDGIVITDWDLIDEVLESMDLHSSDDISI